MHPVTAAYLAAMVDGEGVVTIGRLRSRGRRRQFSTTPGCWLPTATRAWSGSCTRRPDGAWSTATATPQGGLVGHAALAGLAPPGGPAAARPAAIPSHQGPPGRP